MPETLVLRYILAFSFLCVRLEQVICNRMCAQPNPLPHSLGHVSHDHLWKGRRPACIIIWHPTCLPKRSAAPPVCPTLPSGWSRQDLDGSDPGGIEMVLGGILLSSWHIPFSRYLYMHAIVLDVSVLVLGQVELLFRREDHMTKLASFFLTRAGPQAKAGWMNPGVCHRTARLCPRKGMSQLHVLYGLEGGISNHSHDDALLRPRQRRCTHSCERRQGRLQRQAMPFEAFAPTDTQVTQHKQPTPHRTCSRFTRSQAQSGPGCHAGMHLSSASTPSPTASDQDARVSS